MSASDEFEHPLAVPGPNEYGRPVDRIEAGMPCRICGGLLAETTGDAVVCLGCDLNLERTTDQ